MHKKEGLPDAEASLAFAGVIRGRAVLVMQSGDSLIVTPCAKGEAQLFIDYFDLKRDYSAVEAALAADERLRVCLPGSSGIRVFNQEPFEALISFIISANNTAFVKQTRLHVHGVFDPTERLPAGAAFFKIKRFHATDNKHVFEIFELHMPIIRQNARKGKCLGENIQP